MIPIDLHPNLAAVRTLVSFHCVTLYLNNQTAHNWFLWPLLNMEGGRRRRGHPFCSQ